MHKGWKMSNWSDISKNFEKWLKENPEITGIQYEKKDGEFAAIKYSEQFKLFIAQYDGDDDLNMDSFTKSMKTDDNGENKNNTLLQDMMSNYIGNLRTDDKVFQAIDGLDGSEKDGKISEAEKNMFLQKVTDSSVGIDGDADNLTFDEVSKTVGKIIDGDLNIFGVNNTNPIEAVADTQMSATLQQFSDEVSGLSEVLKSWEPYSKHKIKASC